MHSTLLPLHQRGVSLLEVLIAVVVLSLGLLGLAGLQMTALRNNQSAFDRSNAVMLTYSIADIMRSSIGVADGGGFDIASDATPTGSEFAPSQITAWRTRIKDSLGDAATGAISCAALVCTITIEWDDSRGLQGQTTQQLITEVQL